MTVTTSFFDPNMLNNKLEEELNNALNSVIRKPMTDERVSSFFRFPDIKWLYDTWCQAEGYDRNLITLQLFSCIINEETLDNISSHIPMDKRNREEAAQRGISVNEFYAIYKDSDMEFLSLYDALVEHITEGGGILKSRQNTWCWYVNGSCMSSKEELLNIIQDELADIFRYFIRLKEIVVNPFSLSREIDGFPYCEFNPDYKITYNVCNLSEKWLFSHTHFRCAMTAHEPRQYLGTELVWDDTGKEVKRFAGEWLDKNQAKYCEGLGRYDGKADKEPKGMFGHPFTSIERR